MTKLQDNKNTSADSQSQTDSAETVKKTRQYLYFRIILVLLPLLFFAGLELALQLFNYGIPTHLFQNLPQDERFLEINPELGKKYFPNGNFYPRTTHCFMRKEKPENGYRIFVLGGSSGRGYPYYYNGSFSSMLKVMLETSYPSIHFEVINFSMVAVNSFTVRDIAYKLSPYQPDLILIYSGHNEFYGALGAGSVESFGANRAVINWTLQLSEYKTFQLLRNLIFSVRGMIAKSGQNASATSGTVMERMVAKKEIPYGSETYQNGLNSFRDNISDIIDHFKTENIPLIIGDLVSNIKDQKPFVDFHNSGKADAKWQNNYRQARQAFQNRNWSEAVSKINTCIKTDSLPANQYYILGYLQQQLGDSLQAYRAYYKAKDYDALRFRASEDLNGIIRSSTETDGVYLSAVKKEFEKSSPGNLPGKKLMLEHLHPNLEGYFLMAKAYYQSIVSQKFLSGFARPLPPKEKLWEKFGLTALDDEVANIRIKVLMNGWPFKKGKVSNLSQLKAKSGDKLNELALSYWKNEITWEQAHVYLADYYIKKQQYELAEKEFRALIVFTAFNAFPYRHLADILLRQNRIDDALPILKKYIGLKNDLFGNRALGYVYLQKKYPDLALPLLEQALRKAPRDAQILYYLAHAHLMLKNNTEARKKLTQLQQIDPAYPGLAELIRQTETELP